MKRIYAWFLVKTNNNKISLNDKLRIYKATREYYDKGRCAGICHILCDESYRLINIFPDYEEIHIFFPEFYMQKPLKPKGAYWWDGKDRQSRIKALDKAIQIIEKKLNK